MLDFDLGAFSSGLGGVVLGSGLAVIWLQGKLAEIADLRSDVTELKEKRIGRLEREMDELKSGGCTVGRTVLTKIETMIGMQGKMDQKLERIGEETASQRATIAGDRSYIENLDRSIQRHSANLATHLQDRSAHHHG